MSKPALNSQPPAPSLDNDLPGVLECPGLKRTRNAGISWTDSAGTVHDIEIVRMLTPEEVAARLDDLGFGRIDSSGSARVVLDLIRRGRIYPVFRKNARVVRVCECGVPDFRRRQLGAAPIEKIPHSGRHLAAQRAERVA